MDTVEIVTMIKTALLRRGNGIENDPVRVIEQYWIMDGELLFEYDSFKKLVTNVGIGKIINT